MNTRDKPRLEPEPLAEPPISPDVLAEVLRRRATYERDKKAARPWSEILADQLRKHAGLS